MIQKERERKRDQFVVKNVNKSEGRMPLTTNYIRIGSEAELQSRPTCADI